MINKEFNEKAIIDVYKNAHIDLQSISDLLPQVDDAGLKQELKEQYDGYEKIIGEISSFCKSNGIEPKDINPMKKAFMWSSIKMKTMINNSRNQIAEMMIKGTIMGITELTAMKNEGEKLTDEIREFVNRLLTLEESYEERLKKYL